MRKTINLLLFSIIVFQVGCATSRFATKTDDPILQLEQDYSVSLDSTWTTKQARTLQKLFKSIAPALHAPTSIWHISDELQQEIKIDFKQGQAYITVSSDVFTTGASTSLTEKRLFYTIVHFITGNGTNRDILKLILKERYGIFVDIPSYEKLTQFTSNETAKHYSEFENKDLMLMISVFEEFPKALHKIPQLKYIIRRIDSNIRGHGYSWPQNGYIEFAEYIFSLSNVDDVRRLIAHEKTHFLWVHLFSEQLHKRWIELGGWQEDPDSAFGWSTTRDRSEFVSDYAYQRNPEEDMAESFAYYLVFPDKLRACNMAKYKFIHERIVLTFSSRYISPHALIGR